MRILHITSGLGAGGAERSLVQLVNAASQPTTESGIKMQIASLTSTSALAGQLATPPLICDLKRDKFRALRALLSHARRFQPDVIQGWMYHGNLVASYLGWRLGVPVIWSVRHSLERPELESRALRWVLGLGRMGCFQPKRVVYNSYSGWRTHAHYGYGQKPSMIIPNGVDINYFSTNTKRAKAVSGAGDLMSARALPVLGCVARFHPMKGIATLLEAHTSMQVNHPCQLALVGEGMDAGNPELAALIARFGCAEKITLLGRVDNMPAVYAQFRVVVLPSLYGEGTPNAVLEAMACKVPVVVSRVGDAARCLGNNDWLVEPGDAAQLGARVQALLALSVEQRADLIASNTQHIADNYSLTRCHERYTALYHELCESYPLAQNARMPS